MMTISLLDRESPTGLKVRRILTRRKSSLKYYHANREAKRKYQKENQPRNTKYVWEWSLKNEYGISVEIFYQMLLSQSGRCVTCSVALQKLHVDHDHQTGVVRGLLCGPCNMALGLVKEKQEVLRAMIDYLESH